eukprot:Seg6054.1 transcript_id=Seg6054.1/GoldUCD/mRNA.D3Y31 product="hypothetical protein" protein_id=Seg6054.1/GoldUCD/D3Y31
MKAWNLVCDNQNSLDTLMHVGSEFTIDDALIRDIESLKALLYGEKAVTEVNTVRYNMFRLGKFSDESIPPNKDCLVKHLQRANYQAAIWRRAVTPTINAPTPANNGWKIDNSGKLQIDWMDGKCAPDALLKEINSKCKTSCRTMRCSCRKGNNLCNDMCRCEGCANQPSEASAESFDDENNTGYETEEDMSSVSEAEDYDL